MSTSLPEPNFIDRDPEAITQGWVTSFEGKTNKTLQPAQGERLLMDVGGYRETLVREQIQYVGLQNLVRFATFPVLDFLGEWVGVIRLGEQSAFTTLRFTLAAAQAFDVLIPAGTRVESKDGEVIFATSAALTIPAGQTTGDVQATAQTAGIVGNDYNAGDIATLIDPIAHVAGAANTTTSEGGAAIEDDDRYRERILLAPEGYSTAGPGDAYRSLALKANSTIIDVAVESPAPGTIRLYLLTATGTPSAELLDQVETFMDGEKVRPMSDKVEAWASTEVETVWVGELTVLEDADAPSVKAEAEAKLAEYAASLRKKLGQHEVPERIEGLVNPIAGVYRFKLQGVDYRELAGNEWLHVTSITVNLVGAKNG